MIKSSYLKNILSKKSFKKIIKFCQTALEDVPSDVAMVVTGTSGLVVGGVLHRKLNNPLVIVRKPLEIQGHHSEFQVEGEFDFKEYVIIDDFIRTGQTINRIVESISRFNNASLLGIVLYNLSPYHMDEEDKIIKTQERRYSCWIKGTKIE